MAFLISPVDTSSTITGCDVNYVGVTIPLLNVNNS